MKVSLVDEYMRDEIIFLLQSLFLGIGKLNVSAWLESTPSENTEQSLLERTRYKKMETPWKDETTCIPIVRRVRWEHQK